MNDTPKKLNGSSLDVSNDNRIKLKAILPSVFTETVNDNGELVETVDFEKLKAELGTFTELFESRRERYGMDWPGKKEALKLIQTPSFATLKPCREESVNFDNTENLFIEGDNLEVLKLLQKSYYGKVRMIYIDPPYNTGNEFIYPDNYAESLETYLEYAGLIDGEGKKFSTNTANEGRFHTKWLNMMYPRLYLARNLLRDDGVIFISIDDNELDNLKKLCNEIFGEENFISCITRKSKLTSNNGTYFAPSHEYILAYGKILEELPGFTDAEAQEEEDYIDLFKYEDSYSKYNIVGLYQPSLTLERSRNARYFIKCPDGSLCIPPENKRWRVIESSYLEMVSKDLIVFKETKTSPLLDKNGIKSKWNIYTKIYLKDRLVTGMRPVTFIDKYPNSEASKELIRMDIPFDFSKPKNLIKYLLKIIQSSNDDIVLDFFAGSATTAHAVLDLNKQDGGNRRFILVQLPEPCLEDSDACKAGYKTIADIGKERIRRAIKNLSKEDEGKLNFESKVVRDCGFKVFKLDKSNFKRWQNLSPNSKPDQIEKQLEMHIDHIDKKVKPEDLLYEILIKAGFVTTEKVQITKLVGVDVFSIAEGAILICLAKAVTKEFINAVAEAEPMQFICLDSAFGDNDQLKANAVQTFAARNMGREKANQIIFRTI